MPTLVEAAAAVLVAAGFVAGAVTILVTRVVRLGIGVLLDFLLAAGLLRLALPPDPERLGAAAAIVGVRQLVGLQWGALARSNRPK